MSANASISEGGKSYPFGPVKCLMVEGDNGEFCPWHPEADRQLDSLSVTQNGIYRASDRGVYGWNHVSVNVAQSDRVTGKDPETGEEKTVTVDPETGELVETVVPVEIRITTLPTKTEYNAGETIDYSGIVVHAYSSTGQDMGEVPYSELVFPVTTAQVWDGEWTDGQGLNAMQIAYVPTWWHAINNRGQEREGQVFVHTGDLGTYQGRPATYGGNAPGTMFITRYNGNNYGACISGNGTDNLYTDYNGPGGEEYGYRELYGWFRNGSSGGSAGDKIFSVLVWSEYLTNIPESTVNPAGLGISNLHATQSLPVQWQDPDSGAVLETSFTIAVTGGE